MASSYLNIVTFLLTTLFYYMALKPSLPYSSLTDKTKYEAYISNNYMYLAIYIVLVILIQFIVNSSIIASNCGGNITENMGAAGVLTFIPWILIFGVLVIILTIYPGFKSAFSDVVGYYYVSSSANDLITKLLINQDVENALNDDDNSQKIPTDYPVQRAEPSAPPLPPDELNTDQNSVPAQTIGQPIRLAGGKKIKGGGITKQQIQEAADTIIKICGNTSVLINQIVPSNFEEYWGILKPLMKNVYQNDSSAETIKMKNDLFEIVVTRDNVGEAMWYIYTGLLLTSIVQLKITSRGCSSNPKTMEANYQKYLQQEEQNQKSQQNAATTYTLNG